jgi:hypothetical protein
MLSGGQRRTGSLSSHRLAQLRIPIAKGSIGVVKTSEFPDDPMFDGTGSKHQGY